MSLSPSAHLDTFARDHLPPADLWPTIEFTTPELRYPDRLNAATELIDIPVLTHGADRPALRTPDGETWSYGLLQTRANQVAQVLSEDLGLVAGQRVLLRSPNNPWTVAAWLGVLKAGGIVVTTMAALRARELTPIVERTEPSIALVDHRFVEDAHVVRDTVLPSLTVVAYGGTGPADLVERAAAKSGRYTNVQTAADDVALLGPTSGSTGVPKITMHFHRDLLTIDHTFGRPLLGLAATDTVACSAPLAFTFGLGMLVVFPLRAGACVLLTRLRHAVAARGDGRAGGRHCARHGAHRLPGDPSRRPGPPSLRTAGRRVGGRTPAADHLGAAARPTRTQGRRRHRRHGAAAHLPCRGR